MINMKYLENYLNYLEYQKNYSQDTINSYRIDIVEFFEYLNQESIKVEEVDYDVIRLRLMF